MYICPHCNKPGISLLRRSFLGAAFPATCKSCGKKIGVPYGKSMLSIAPFLIALVINIYMPALSLIVLPIGIVAMFVLHFKYVPLIKR